MKYHLTNLVLKNFKFEDRVNESYDAYVGPEGRWFGPGFTENDKIEALEDDLRGYRYGIPSIYQ